MDPEIVRLLREISETFQDLGEKIQASFNPADPFDPGGFNQDGTLTTKPQNRGDGRTLTTDERSRWKEIAEIFSDSLGLKNSPLFRFEDDNENPDTGPLKVIITGVSGDLVKQLQGKDEESQGLITGLLGGITGLAGGVGSTGGFITALQSIGVAAAGGAAALGLIAGGIWAVGNAIDSIDTEKFLDFWSGFIDLFMDKGVQMFDYILERSDKISNFFQNTLGVAVPGVLNQVRSTLSLLLENVKDFISIFSSNIFQPVLQTVETVVTSLIDGIKSIATDPNVLNFIETIIPNIVSGIETLGRTTGDVIEQITPTITSVLGILGVGAERILNIVKELYKGISNNIVLITDSILDGMITIISNVSKVLTDSVLSSITNIIDKIKTVLTDTTFNETIQSYLSIVDNSIMNTFNLLDKITNFITSINFKQSIQDTFESLKGITTFISDTVINSIERLSNITVGSLREINEVDPTRINDLALAYTKLAGALTLQNIAGGSSIISKATSWLFGADSPVEQLKKLSQVEPSITKLNTELKGIVKKLTYLSDLSIDIGANITTSPIAVNVEEFNTIHETIEKTSKMELKIMSEQLEETKKMNENIQKLALYLSRGKNTSINVPIGSRGFIADNTIVTRNGVTSLYG